MTSCPLERRLHILGHLQNRSITVKLCRCILLCNNFSDVELVWLRVFKRCVEIFSYSYNLTHMCFNFCFFENWFFWNMGEEYWKAEPDRKKCMSFFFFSFALFYLYSLYKPKFAKSLWNSSTFNILVKTAEEDSMLFCANREWKKDGYCPRQHTVHKDNLGSQEMDTDRWWIKEKSEALLVSLMDSDHHISRLLAVYPSIMTTPSFKGEVRIKEWNCVVSIDCEVQYGSQHEHA